MKLVVTNVKITGNSRREVMAGRKYVVFPITILVEGVHNGSGGAILYRRDDMETFCLAWNHKPIVVYHPKKGSRYVSANSPRVLSESQIGILLNNRMQGRKQNAEAWIELERVKAVGNQKLIKAINRGLQIEVSTGLFASFEEKEGVWRGEHYESIAREYRPDHLAVLPDQVGACSLKDGCGMFTAAKAIPTNRMVALQRKFNKVLSGKDASHNCSCHKKDKTMKKNKKKMSVQARRKAVASLMEGPTWNEDDEDWLEEQNDATLKKLMAKDEEIVEANEAEEKANRKKKAKALQAKLNNSDDDDDEDDAPARNKKGKKGKKEKPEAAFNKFLKTVPPEFRERVKQGLVADAANRTRLTDIIMSNDENEFEEEELAAMDVNQLKKIASFAAQASDQDDDDDDDDDEYSAYAGVTGGARTMNSNREKEPALEHPTLNLRPRKRKGDDNDE